MSGLISFLNVILAQGGGGPLPGQGAPQADPANGAPAPGPGNLNTIFLFMLFAIGLMIVFSMLGQRREKKKREAMINSIKKHDRVQTIGGVIGSIVELKPDTVVLKVDESSNTRITFARSAVTQIIKSTPEKAAEET